MGLWHQLVSFVTGEHWLGGEDGHPNGGGVVLARSLWCSVLVYAIILIVKEAIDPTRTGGLSLFEARMRVTESVTWLGAIFAGCYVSLYTRFASQWSYLAGLYNQIIAAQIASPDTTENAARFVAWKASFIEDAIDLHLARKPMFLPTIKYWLEDDAVYKWFIDNTMNAKAKLKTLGLARAETPALPG